MNQVEPRIYQNKHDVFSKETLTATLERHVDNGWRPLPGINLDLVPGMNETIKQRLVQPVMR